MKKNIHLILTIFLIVIGNLHTSAQTVSMFDIEIAGTAQDVDIRFGNGPGFTTSLNEGYDAGYIFTATPTNPEDDVLGGNTGIYTLLVDDNNMIPGTAFMIQTLPYADIGNMDIPLGVNVAADGNDTISLDNITAFPAGHRIILEDRDLGIFTELQGATDSYTTFLTAAEPEKGRFFLHTTTDATAPNTPETPVLHPASDSGIQGDNLTNNTTPSFTLACTELNSTLKGFINNIHIPTFVHTCTSIGTTVFTPTFFFPEGPYNNLTYVEIDKVGNQSLHSNAVSGEIDITAPPTPTCNTDPNPASNGTLVTTTCTGVEVGATLSIPNMNCTPIPTSATGEVSCTGTVGTGIGEINTSDDTVTVTDPAGNANTNTTTGLITKTLRITEVEYDTTQNGNDNQYEWIEIYNYGTEDINLSGWTISDSNPTTITLPSTVIKAGEFFLLVNNINSFQINYPLITPNVDLSPSLGLNNTGDSITLREPSGSIIDFVAWEGDYTGWDTNANAGESICRLNVNNDTGNPSDFTVCTNPMPQNYSNLTPDNPTVAADLQVGSDTGASDIDNVTTSTTPSFDVICSEAGNVINLYSDIPAANTRIGTHTCVGVGTETATVSPAIASGVHNITYTDSKGGSESGHSPSLTIDVDTTAPIDPTIGADLESGSDSGLSNSDDITNEDLPDMTVSCSEVGSTITLYSNVPAANTVVGTHTCTAVGLETASVSVSLTDGIHSITYTETDIAGNESGISPSLSVTIDTVAPLGVTINTPTLGAPVTGYTEVGVSVTATASNGGTCTVNPTAAGGTGIYPGAYICHLSPGAVDGNDITAVSTDIAGNSVSTTVQSGIKIVGGSVGKIREVIHARFPNESRCLDIYPNNKTGGDEPYNDYLQCKNQGRPGYACANTWAKQVGLILCTGYTNTDNIETTKNEDYTRESISKDETPEIVEKPITKNIVDNTCSYEQLDRQREKRGTGLSSGFYADEIQNKSSHYYNALVDLTEQGIMNGRVTGRNNVRRAELRNFVQRVEAAKLYSMAREDAIVPTQCLKNQFPDTALHAWYYSYVDNLKEEDILHGYKDGSFKPMGNITYAETYKITALSFGFITKEEANQLAIDNNIEWYVPYKNVLIENGIIPNEVLEKEDHLFITRGEMIELIYRSLRILDGLEI